MVAVAKNKEPSVIGKRLRAIRLAAGMTQAELGAAGGWSQDAVARMENSPKWNPTAETLTKLADALGCTPNDLMGFGAQLPAE